MPKKKKGKARKKIQSFFDKIEAKIETANIRDVAFVASWLAGTYVIYNFINLAAEKGDVARQDIFAFLQKIPLLNLLPAPPAKGEATLAMMGEDLKVTLSIFLSYKILTTDLESGLGALTSLIGLI